MMSSNLPSFLSSLPASLCSPHPAALPLQPSSSQSPFSSSPFHYPTRLSFPTDLGHESRLTSSGAFPFLAAAVCICCTVC